MKYTTHHLLKYSLFICTLALSSSVLAEPKTPTKFVVDTCLGCHGLPSYTNVYPSYHVPRLAGQHKAYLISALQEYQKGNRQHPTMKLQSKTLSETQIEQAADYFSSMKSAPTNPTPDIPKAIEAKVGTCTACHTADGNSAVPTFPKIAGQHKNYLYHALQSYKNGQRKNPIMLGIVQALSDADMKALSEYYSKQAGLSDITLSIQSTQKQK